MDKNKNYIIEVVVDRFVVKDGIEMCLVDFIEIVFEFVEGNLIVDVINGEEFKFFENYVCFICGFFIGELEFRMFSFNSLFGVCLICDGLG